MYSLIGFVIELSYPKTYRNQSSKKCGFLACFFVYKSVSSSVPKFLRLRKMLLNNSVSTNENYIFNFVRKHFDLNL